jgi:hypothetical protein
LSSDEANLPSFYLYDPLYEFERASETSVVLLAFPFTVERTHYL